MPERESHYTVVEARSGGAEPERECFPSRESAEDYFQERVLVLESLGWPMQSWGTPPFALPHALGSRSRTLDPALPDLFALEMIGLDVAPCDCAADLA